MRQAFAERRTARSTQPGIDLGTSLAAIVGLLAVGAGVLHLLASRDHIEHPPVSAFFACLAVAQIAWAPLVVWRRSPVVLQAGIAGNLAVVAIWIFSRTTGIPIMDATREAEAIGIADAVATLFELTSAAGAGLLLALPGAALVATIARPRAQRLIAGTGAVALLLTVPAFVTEAPHVHSDAHHDSGRNVLASAHTHDGTDVATDEHAHGAAPTHGKGGAPHTHGVQALSAEPRTHVHRPGGVHGTKGHVPDGSAVHSHDPSNGAGEAHSDAHDDESRPQEPAIAPPPGEVAEMLYGPFVLPAVDRGGQAHYNRVLPAIAPPCVNCMVTAMIPDLVYADGSSANLNTGAMLHHAVLFDPLREDPTCSRNDGAVGFIGHRVFASGNERTAKIMPRGYAIKIDSPWWVGIFEIMNHAPSEKVVFFKLTVRHLPMNDPSVKPVTPIWLDVDNCGDSQFGVPKGESLTKWRWESNVTGRIVGTGGHVHDGGLWITLSNATRRQRMCTSYAGYGTKPEFMGAVERMSICVHDRIGVVRAGEYLQIETYYNARQAAGDVMGIMMAYVYETDDLSGGSAPPEYYTAAPPEHAPPPQSGEHQH